MNRALGQLCAYIGYTGPGQPPEDGEMIEMPLSSRHTANWCLIVRTREDTSAALIVYPTLGRCHQHVAQCCETFNRPSGIQIVCLGYFWFHRNVD